MWSEFIHVKDSTISHSSVKVTNKIGRKLAGCPSEHRILDDSCQPSWIIFRFLCMIALVFWFLDLNNHVSIYEYKHVYNIFANMYILLVLENT